MPLLKKAVNKLKPNPWRAFAREVRGRQEKLLTRLDDFPDSILITGCQRSGTTMLSGVIAESEGMFKFWFSDCDEHDAARILSGAVPHLPQGRYCFQTTYLNERCHEYLEHPGHRIVWVLRNPHSVVHSMLYNWKDFALNELFLACGYGCMDYADRVRYQRFGLAGIPRVRRAAYAYNGKVSQAAELKRGYPAGRMAVLEYDQLVKEKDRLLPLLYEFIDLPFKVSYGRQIKASSLAKKDRLTDEEARTVESICMPVYQAALAEVTIHTADHHA